MPVMQYADNRELRARMYRAYATRASEFGDAKLDNGPLMDEIVKLRGEEATKPHIPGARRRVRGGVDPLEEERRH